MSDDPPKPATAAPPEASAPSAREPAQDAQAAPAEVEDAGSAALPSVIVDPALAHDRTPAAAIAASAAAALAAISEPEHGRAARASDIDGEPGPAERSAGEPSTAEPSAGDPSAAASTTAEPSSAERASEEPAASTWPERDRRVGERRSGDRRAPSSEGAGASPAEPVEIDDDGWPLDSAEDAPLAGEAAAPAAPAAPATQASQLPSPAAAAYEAARIVGEMVGDIESAPGAALMAAAAAGAAIEAARARVAAGEPERPATPPPDPTNRDPVVTVRMQRERILRALADDIAATTAGAAAAAAPATGERAASQPGLPGRETARAASHPGVPGVDDEFDDGIDPVAIAAAAIARLRDRARSDLAELRVHYHRLDILVLVLALVIIAVASRFHTDMVTPPLVPFDPGADHGLAFDHPRGWLVSPGEPPPPPRIVHEPSPSPARPASAPYRAELTSTSDPTARIEVVIDKKPAWSNIVTGLDLDRRTRWGELYALDDSSVRSIEDHQWLRTAYRFAHAVDKGDVPRIDRALEYATIDREQIYVITLFGSPAAIDQLEDLVAPTLRVASQTGLPLVPQTGHLSTRQYPNAVAHAFDATVMVVVADVVDGRLRARGGGSGVIVGKDGSILTNYHVIHDRNGRLHDAFVIGRFSDQDKAPQLHCAGKPSRSKLQRELDLALIKCDLDLDGRTWNPAKSGAAWPTLPLARTADIKIGQRIWVLGYPDVGGGGLTLSEGEIEGWSGVDGAAGKDFLKTDAAIRHGNSGGPVVGDDGRLVGIASAVRTKQTAAGDIVEVVQAGGRVRPIAAASDLLAIAAAGWTPREGATDVDLQPSAIEVPAEGVQIQSRVLDAANQAPVRDALVMVLRPGVNASTVDVNRLDDQVLAYGRSNAQGEVVLKQPVPAPGTYTLMVVARGYEPVIGEGALTLASDTPPVFDPWTRLLLRSR